jgi:phosphatidylserine decarboxylase
MIIHKEGYKFLFYAFFILIVLNGGIVVLFYENNLLIFISLVFTAILLLFSLFFFRSPNRIVEKNERFVYAPADGKILVIEEIEEGEYFHCKRIQVSTFMSLFNIHVNRYPVSGEVKYKKHQYGKHLLAWLPKSSYANEQTTVVIDNGKGVEVMVRQIAGAVARRIVSNAKIGEKVNQGDELGIVKFGSRVDLFLPPDAKINVSLHQKVRGNKSVIAEL